MIGIKAPNLLELDKPFKSDCEGGPGMLSSEDFKTRSLKAFQKNQKNVAYTSKASIEKNDMAVEKW